ncbi:50S ribosomal protein L2 [Candidatus Parcubacteria bacterium]|nr:50S ribosomal protein L2 [Candidatus Parcubacteria bacterium]
MKTAITKTEPEKKLVKYIKKKAGRSTQTGQITVRHRGGGVKRLYRIVDFGQEKLNIPGKVIAIEYDPNRTAYIMLVEYQDGDKRYLLAPEGIKVGDEILCKEDAEIKIGNRVMLKNIPIGTQVFNIELIPGQGGKLVRAAGTAATIVGQEKDYTILELPSKEKRRVFSRCFATIGQVSNPSHIFEDLKKAGKRRLKGWRPTVRGKAMNPVDHPHGGGKGKAPIGMPMPKTPWGKPAKGVKTRKKKWTDKLIIEKRKK